MNGTPNEFEVAAIIFLATDDASPTSDPRPTSATPLAIPMDSPAAPGAASRASSGAPAETHAADGEPSTHRHLFLGRRQGPTRRPWGKLPDTARGTDIEVELLGERAID